MSDTSNYFDESYFQHGSTKGTVYENYLQASRDSKIYKEIVEALIYVFQPKRVLEIGCATGIMVKYFNENGIEAHGIDISHWAVENREHENVIHASAGDLPYPDQHFDLVFSCHAIEHLPDEIFLQGLREITRVTSKFQFHMLPMVGVRPYVGNFEEVINNLKKDPTHAQLHNINYWIQQFEALGNNLVSGVVAFAEDNERCELTNGQMIFSKDNQSEEIQWRVAEWTKERYERVKRKQENDKNVSFKYFSLSDSHDLIYTERSWQDIQQVYQEDQDFSAQDIYIIVLLEGPPSFMRLALVQDRGIEEFSNVMEKTIQLQTGYYQSIISQDSYRILRGNPNLKKVNRILFGGETESSKLKIYLLDREGKSLIY